jgi:hypothetical protein
MSSEEEYLVLNIGRGLSVQTNHLLVESLPLRHTFQCATIFFARISTIDEAEILFVLDGLC